MILVSAIGGVGLVGVTLGAAFGMKARSDINEWMDRCDTGRCSDNAALALRRDAYSSTVISVVGFGVGALACFGAAIATALATTPTSSPQTIGKPAPLVSPHGLGARW